MKGRKVTAYRIRTMRRLIGLPQADLAVILDVSQPFVSQIENEDVACPSDLALKIEQELNLPLGMISGDADKRVWADWAKAAKQNPAVTTPTVYFMRCGIPNSPVKIGYSVAPAARMRAAQMEQPWQLEMVATLATADARKIESRLHDHLASSHIRHAWYHSTPQLLHVITLAKNNDADSLRDLLHVQNR